MPADPGARPLPLAVERRLRLLRVGIVGAAIAALCCFTPVLVALLGALGLATLSGYLDYVLFPALAFFVGLTIYAVYTHRLD